ncbi:hypothetical protein QN277_025865 [Acacia crassicarpa]|uniref:Uncharacterized protein n=1 Tax=Acacia crassicarpa TaxID=499986 RepID=A0AAE1MLC5_9FABA|nr:hypothetical protein QN277_025865 [Acacia crassicarpa]
MLSHTQELVGNRHVPSSTQSRCGSGGDREFSFWRSSSNTESSANDCVGLLGRSEEGTGFKSKHSTLMPSSHHCYGVAHNSRSQAIAESRKEVMQMLQDLPESAFELSFQYMVQLQQQQASQPVQNEAYIDKEIKNSANEAQVTKKDTKEKEKKKKPNQILRVESMDNENFLLKMFFPSLNWKKKAKVGNVPKLSRTPSFNNHVKQIGKQQRNKSSQTGDNRNYLKDHTDESTNNCRKRCGKKKARRWQFLTRLLALPCFLKNKETGRIRMRLNMDA